MVLASPHEYSSLPFSCEKNKCFTRDNFVQKAESGEKRPVTDHGTISWRPGGEALTAWQMIRWVFGSEWEVTRIGITVELKQRLEDLLSSGSKSEEKLSVFDGKQRGAHT